MGSPVSRRKKVSLKGPSVKTNLKNSRVTEAEGTGATCMHYNLPVWRFTLKIGVI